MGLDQINDAIAQMDAVTQQNAALVEQAAAAADSMKQQAATLKEAVSLFKIHERYAAPAPAATARHMGGSQRGALQASKQPRTPVRRAAALPEQEWEEL